jgi:hypothetical protein
MMGIKLVRKNMDLKQGVKHNGKSGTRLEYLFTHDIF